MFAAVSGGVFGGDGMPEKSEWLLWLIVAMAFTCIIIRSFMIGVWVGARRTRVRGWYISVRFENKDFRRVSAVGYSGLLNEGNTDGSAKILKALLVQIRRDGVAQQYYVAGLIASRGSAARQVRSIDLALDRPAVRK
jgi:hypothetical protein